MGLIKQTEIWLIMALIIVSCTTAPAYHLEKGELFPDGKPVGQPYTWRHTDIRMVRVCSVQEADSFFVALCRKNKYEHVFTFYKPHGSDIQYYQNGSNKGEMTYTHDVPYGTHEVGIIHIRDSVINVKGIREVHFVKTIE